MNAAPDLTVFFPSPLRKNGCCPPAGTETVRNLSSLCVLASLTAIGRTFS